MKERGVLSLVDSNSSKESNGKGDKEEVMIQGWKAAGGGMAVVKMAHYVGAKNFAGGLLALRACNTPDGIVMPPGNEEKTEPTEGEAPQDTVETEKPEVEIPTYTPEQIEQHKQTIKQFANTEVYHLYNYNIPDPIPPDLTIPLPPPECADASIPHRLLEVLTTLRLRYEEGGMGTDWGGHAAAATGEKESSLHLDAQKLAAAAGGTYDEDADPLNAPEVVNAVLDFKRSLEDRDVKSRKRRVDIVTAEMEKKVKELVERGRREREERRKMAAGGAGPVANGGAVEANGAAPAVSADAKEDTGRRGVSNLPAWMTQSKPDGAPANEAPTTEGTIDTTEDESKKRKFVPSEANRDDINVRKQRIDMEGASLAEIRAANEAADKQSAVYTTKEDILAAWTMFPPLSSSANTAADKIKTFVTEKIVEYVGEEEAELIDFIMKKLTEGVKTTALLEEMKLPLDEDAEEFVLGLYKRMTAE
jgi:hypothetical protein